MIFKRVLCSLLVLIAAHAAMAVEYAEEKPLSVSGKISSVDVAQKLVRVLDDSITLDVSTVRLIGLPEPQSLDQLQVGMDILATVSEGLRDNSGQAAVLDAESLEVVPAGRIIGEVWTVDLE